MNGTINLGRQSLVSLVCYDSNRKSMLAFLLSARIMAKIIGSLKN